MPPRAKAKLESSGSKIFSRSIADDFTVTRPAAFRDLVPPDLSIACWPHVSSDPMTKLLARLLALHFLPLPWSPLSTPRPRGCIAFLPVPMTLILGPPSWPHPWLPTLRLFEPSSALSFRPPSSASVRSLLMSASKPLTSRSPSPVNFVLTTTVVLPSHSLSRSRSPLPSVATLVLTSAGFGRLSSQTGPGCSPECLHPSLQTFLHLRSPYCTCSGFCLCYQSRHLGKVSPLCPATGLHCTRHEGRQA